MKLCVVPLRLLGLHLVRGPAPLRETSEGVVVLERQVLQAEEEGGAAVVVYLNEDRRGHEHAARRRDKTKPEGDLVLSFVLGTQAFHFLGRKWQLYTQARAVETAREVLHRVRAVGELPRAPVRTFGNLLLEWSLRPFSHSLFCGLR